MTSLNRSVFILATLLITPLGAFAADKIGVIGAANQHITAIDENSQKRDMSIGKDIFFKDTISTDSTGNAQLLFIDKSALTVGANSSVVIDEFVFNPSTSSGNMVMNGTKGTFRFIGGALSKKNAVKIKTPVGTIGIRGGIAIVNVNPDTGATNATFVYGHQMTFENAAGQITTTTSSGTGFSLNSPTDIPKIIQFTQAQIDTQMNALEAREGTNAGAKIVPTEGDVKGGLIMEKKDGGPVGANPTDKNAQGGGTVNNNGKPTPGGQTAATGDNKNPNGTTAANNPNNPAGTAAATGSGHYTADGGYVDSGGKYYTAREVAEYHAAHIDEGGRISDKDQSSGNYVVTANSPNNPNGTPATNGGAYVGPAAGGYAANGTAPVTGGYNNGTTYGGGYAGTAANGYVAPAAGGAYGTAVGTYNTAYVSPAAYNNYGNIGYMPNMMNTYNTGLTTTYYNPYTPYTPYNPAPTVYVDPYATSGASNIDSMATVLYNEAYNKVISAGGTSAQALAAAVIAQQYFKDHVFTGTEFNAAITATRVNTDTYMTSNFPGWTPSGTNTTTYVPPVKPSIVNSGTYSNAVAVGQAAYLADRNNGYDHSHAVGAANSAYNNSLTNQQQANSNAKVTADYASGTDHYTLANEAVNTSAAISSPLLAAMRTGAQNLALQTNMDTNKSNCNGGCAYVNWGIWEHVQQNSSPSLMNDINEQVVPYVYGNVTNLAGLSPMTVNYTGSSVLATSGIGIETGTIHANITLNPGSATLNSFDFNIPSQGAGGTTLNLLGGSQSIGASFSGINLSGGGFNGQINGSLFGPQAQSIGGNMVYGNGGAANGSGGSISGAGVYIGGRP